MTAASSDRAVEERDHLNDQSRNTESETCELVAVLVPHFAEFNPAEGTEQQTHLNEWATSGRNELSEQVSPSPTFDETIPVWNAEKRDDLKEIPAQIEPNNNTTSSSRSATEACAVRIQKM